MSKKSRKNKKAIKTLSALITAVIILVGSYIVKDEAFDIDLSQEDIAFPYSIVQVEKEGIEPFGYIDATVTRVTDGDTLRVEYKGQEYKVRLLDIDTPESVKAGVEPQPFAAEASEFTKKVLSDKKVKLIFEKGTTDQFDRLLAHLILEDGTFYNAMMVKNGYAICVFYSPNTLLKDYYKELQNEAIQNKMGFWALPEKDRPFVQDSKGNFVASYKAKKDAA